MNKGPYVLTAANVWRSPGRTDRPASGASSGGFVDNVTMPRFAGRGNPTNNVGNLIDSQTGQLVPQTTVANVTQAAGKVHQNLIITGHTPITQPGQKFINCRGTFSYTGDSGGGIFYPMSSVLNAPAARTEFHFCEIEPGNPGDRYNGVYGHDFYFYRSVIRKTVDGIGAYNSSGKPNNIVVQSSWIGWLAWFSDDWNGGRQNGHSDGSGTHNDGIQNGACPNVEVYGSFWQGAKYNALNPGNVTLTADGMGYTVQPGNGVDVLSDNLTTKFGVWCGQCYLGKADAYAPVGNITYKYNWLWNWDHGFKLQSNGNMFNGARQFIDNVTITDNVFGGVWKNWGGSQLFYPIRYDTNCEVNGIRRSTAGPFVDTWNNRWDENSNPGKRYGDGTLVAGSPVRHRVDVVAAATV